MIIMMGNSKNWEKLKNVLLVVLFLSTVLLLYVFWGNFSLDKINLTDFSDGTEEDLPPVTKVTTPTEVDIYFGNDLYTVLDGTGRIWEAGLEQLGSFCKSKDVKVEVISPEKYHEVMRHAHISYRFSYNVPAHDFFSYIGTSSNSAMDSIGSFRSIVWSEGSQESLFFNDKENGIHYRAYLGEDALLFTEIMDRLENSEYVSYYSLGTFAENDVRTLVPLALTSALAKTSWEGETLVGDKGKAKDYAQTFFGENFDFVRKITERTGNRIYMYGYGQKVLTMNAAGSSEYKEETLNSGETQDYFSALETGMQFVAAHGGWPDYEEDGIFLYVKTMEKLEQDKSKGYRIVFGIKTKQGEVFYEGSEAVILEIFNGQVTYYFRNLIQVRENRTENREKEAYSAVNMLAENYEIVAKTMSENGMEISLEDKENLFNNVCSYINRVIPGYLLESDQSRSQQNKYLKPVWAVEADTLTFYFDLYTAKFLGADRTVE